MSKRPLGKHQRNKLVMLASFGRFQVVPDAETRSLAKRGLVREWGDDAFVGITSAGFRLIADEMDAGRLENKPNDEIRGRHTSPARDRAMKERAG